MADDTSKRGPQDASKINVHEPWEVRYWTEKFGITAEKLEEAVKAVGPGVAKVTDYLGKS